MEPNKKITVEISSGTILRVILFILAMSFLYLIRDIVAIIFFAILLILILQPAVGWLSRYHIPRALSVIIIYLLLAAFFSLAIILVIPPIADQSSQMVIALQKYSQQFFAFFGYQVSITPDSFDLKNILSNLPTIFDSISPQNLFNKLSNIIAGVVSLAMVMIITFYGLVEESAFKRIMRSVVPTSYQPYLYQIASRVQRKLGQWVRGQLILAFIIFLLVFIGLSILGVKYALVLALMAGILEFIPYLGPILAGSLAVFLTFFESPISALLVGIMFVVIQQIENHLLVPKVMQRVTGLNPVISIIALLIGARVGGMVGLVLAIPFATTLSVFVQDFFEKRGEKMQLEENYDQS